MAASKQDIRGWLEHGKKLGCTHVIVACDTYDWDDYPVYVYPGQDVRAVYNDRNGQNMQKVMEVYNLSMDLDAQMEEARTFNF